jgi:hypothetical protein
VIFCSASVRHGACGFLVLLGDPVRVRGELNIARVGERVAWPL